MGVGGARPAHPRRLRWACSRAFGGAPTAWPRFVTSGLHRNLTLLSIAFVAVHVLATVADGYTPIGLRDAVIPFVSPVPADLARPRRDRVRPARRSRPHEPPPRPDRLPRCGATCTGSPTPRGRSLSCTRSARAPMRAWAGCAPRGSCASPLVALAVLARAAAAADAPTGTARRRGADGADRAAVASRLVPVRPGAARLGAPRRHTGFAARRVRRTVRVTRPLRPGSGATVALASSAFAVLADRNAAADAQDGRSRRHRDPRAVARRRGRIGPGRPPRAAGRRRRRVDDRERRLVRAGGHADRLRRQRHGPRRPACVRERRRARRRASPAVVRSEHRRSTQRGERIDVGQSRAANEHCRDSVLRPKLRRG